MLWEQTDVLKLPPSSVSRHGEGWAVFVAEDGHARLRELKIGQRNAAEVQVLGGIEAGIRVVKHPPNTLKDAAAIFAQSE